MLSSVLVLAFLLRLGLSLENGLSRTPAMGYNPYNAFSCSIVENQYHQQAELIVSLGLKDLGYSYFGVDCGWQGKQREANGSFTWDKTHLPSGPQALGEFVHGLGLKYALYSDAGYYACDPVGGTAGYIGSLGYEYQDAVTFANWGADYLKYDNCFAVSKTDFVNYNPPIQLKPHFETMRDALEKTGRQIVYAACNWGVQDPARTWPGSEVANSWRMSNDIAPGWKNVFRIINQVVPITTFAGPGGWNDLDMLEVGNVGAGLTIPEQQTHFVLWAAAKSPLIISTDLTRISAESLAILKNKRIIALNQDRLGRSIEFKRRYTDDYDVWAGPLDDGSIVAVVYDLSNSARSLTFNLADVGLSSASATDLLSGQSLGVLKGSYAAHVEAHGPLVLKLSNGAPAGPPSFTYYNSASARLSGGAAIRNVNASVSVVGQVGQGSSVTFTGLNAGSVGGGKLLAIDYINADYTFSGDVSCPNCRYAYARVNGGKSIRIQLPISGQSWDLIFTGYQVRLDGFVAGNGNSVELSNPDGWAPDFYRLGIQA